MKSTATRMITNDLQRLAEFQDVLQVTPEGEAVSKAFRLKGADLGLFSRAAADQVHGDTWTPRSNRSVIVDDVDREHQRLQGFVTECLDGRRTCPGAIDR